MVLKQPVIEKKDYIDTTFEDLWQSLNPDSQYTDLQKEQIFNNRYKGNYVKWTGNVIEIETTILGKVKMKVEHDKGTSIVYMPYDEIDKASKLSKGKPVNFEGKLDSYQGVFNLIINLNEGKILS